MRSRTQKLKHAGSVQSEAETQRWPISMPLPGIAWAPSVGGCGNAAFLRLHRNIDADSRTGSFTPLHPDPVTHARAGLRLVEAGIGLVTG